MKSTFKDSKKPNNKAQLPKSHWRRINKNKYRYRYWLFIGHAYEIAEKNEFEALPKVANKKNPWQTFTLKGNPKRGDLFLATEEEVQPLRMAIKAAHSDIKNERYTGKVKDVINEFEKLKAKQYLKKGVKRRIDNIGVEDL